MYNKICDLFRSVSLGSVFSLVIAFVTVSSNQCAVAQNESIARNWNEILLHAIRTDFARPTVHARNLYHLSAAHYDCFSAYSPENSTFFLGNEINGFTIPFEGVTTPVNIDSARHEAICYASYRLLKHRFQNSPGYTGVLFKIDSLMNAYNYSIQDTSTNYISNGPHALGNYIAQHIIMYGLQDGSNEQNGYENIYYTATNPPIAVEDPGNPDIIDPNHWQAISLTTSIDQSGNEVSSTPDHLSPEWGNVDPFSLDDSLITLYSRNGEDYKVFLDPGDPAYIDTTDTLGLSSLYKWNFCMVSIWQSHLDPGNGVMIDISPASRGNLSSYPLTKEDHPSFYDFLDGGVQQTTGHSINPITGNPYDPQIVPQGDYARVLAEFWADGIDSETPPGHWFEILHSVLDDTNFVRQWEGQGDTLSILEYDVRAHFVLGGAMHDAAVSAWSVKGWYDFIRPVSAIRYMARLGQCSDTNQLNFHPGGIPLISNYIELVEPGDPLEGSSQENVGKIKLYTWKGPDHITDPQTDIAGVDWILAENWWPYQRPTFVTPPFAGYVSGHSTFSRTAANVLTSMTGSPYFPGGMGEFHAEQNNFLAFEQGPSVDITLQWATYQDAADECSLSRIWGGIHPPVDDVPGRLMGDTLGMLTFNFGNNIINSKQPKIESLVASDQVLNISDQGNTFTLTIEYDTIMNTSILPSVSYIVDDPMSNALVQNSIGWINDTVLEIEYSQNTFTTTLDKITMKVEGGENNNGVIQNPNLFYKPFIIDTKAPELLSHMSSDSIVNNNMIADEYTILFTFSESCDTTLNPNLTFINNQINNSLALNLSNSFWSSDSSFKASFTILDDDVIIDSIEISVVDVFDNAGNPLIEDTLLINSRIDTKEALLVNYSISDTLLNRTDFGTNALVLDFEFSKKMNTSNLPMVLFQGDSLFEYPLLYSPLSNWSSDTTCSIIYHLDVFEAFHISVDLLLDSIWDQSYNIVSSDSLEGAFILDTKRPEIEGLIASNDTIYDGNVGNQSYFIEVTFSEKMDTLITPVLELFKSNPLTPAQFNPFNSYWSNDSIFKSFFNISDENVEIDSLNLSINFGKDFHSNGQLPDTLFNISHLDTKNPSTNIFNANTYTVTDGTSHLSILFIFDESMDQNIEPDVNFSETDANLALTYDSGNSQWYNDHTFERTYSIENVDLQLNDVAIILTDGKDLAGNLVVNDTMESRLNIDLNYLGTNQETISEFVVFPNPVKHGELLSIQTKSGSGDFNIEILDITGRKIKSISTTTGSVNLLVGDWKPGLYFVNWQSGNKIRLVKIIVTNE